MKKKIHIFYSGKVQGIGFRYTVLSIAKQNKVQGWVKNLQDSRVEAVAQAEEEALNNFLNQINQHFSNYIAGSEIEWLAPERDFKDFSIRF